MALSVRHTLLAVPPVAQRGNELRHEPLLVRAVLQVLRPPAGMQAGGRAGKEAGRQAGKEAGRQAGREGKRERGRDGGGREVGREERRETLKI